MVSSPTRGALLLEPRRPRRARRRARLAIAALVLGALAHPAASQADPNDVERAREQTEAVRSDAAEAEARLTELARDAELAIERYNEVNVELGRVQARLAQEMAEFEGVQQRISRRSDVAADFARRLYQHGSAFGLEALLASDSVADMQDRAIYLRTAAESHYEVVEGLKVDRNVQLTQVADLERTRAVVAARERELEAIRVDVEATLAAQADEVAALREQVAAAEADLSAAEEAERAAREAAEQAAREEAERIAAAEAAAATAAAEAAAREAARQAAAAASAEPPVDAPAPPSSVGSDAGQIAVEAALSQLGKPYVYAADGPDSYDCSGLTMWAWAHAGVSLPHSSRMQYAATSRVSFDDMQPGDLLFFGSPIHHVAMYIGNGEAIEAPYTGSQVRINPETIYRDDLVGIGRP